MKQWQNMGSGWRWALVGVAVIGLGGASYGIARGGWLGGAAEKSASAAQPVRYWMNGGAKAAEVTAGIRAAGFEPVEASSADTADVVFSAHSETGAAGVLPGATGKPAVAGTATLVTATQGPTLYMTRGSQPHLAAADLDELTAELRTAAPASHDDQEWTLAAVGDVIIGRTVYSQMRKYGDMERPFAYYAQTLAGADLALADLECAFSDTKPVLTDGGMTFVSPYAAAAGLKTAGIDAVSVANNHSFNGGAAGYTGTLGLMDSLGVKTFGGGANVAEARTPRIMTVKGTKIALLGYSSIVGSTPAGAATPGMNYISMAPWGPFSEPDVARMEADIQAAKAQADVVMVYYHWGTEYTHDANADQRTVAHRAIDAGADLILGTHPHWVQGVEWYKDRLITYSLGNFIFDQAWAPETTQGTYLSATFSGSRLIKADLVPYQIADYNQPRAASPAVSATIFRDIFAHSWWIPSQSSGH